MLEGLHARGVTLLVTSRKAVNACLGGAAMLRLGAMTEAAGQELLLALAGDVADWGHNQAVKLVDMCRGNALAITILAGFIHGAYITPEVRKTVGTEQPLCAFRLALPHSLTAKQGCCEVLQGAVILRRARAAYTMHTCETCAGCLNHRKPSSRARALATSAS